MKWQIVFYSEMLEQELFALTAGILDVANNRMKEVKNA